MRNRAISIFVCTLLLFGAIAIVPGTMSVKNTNNSPEFYGMRGVYTTLISDNNHIIEVNESKDTIWDYIIGTVDAERLSNGNTLLGGGVLVKEINIFGIITWQYATGLLVVSDVERLDNGNTLITDFSNNFVIEINDTGHIQWQISGLSFPMDAERLDNGNTLIVNNLNNYVIEVNSTGHTVWDYTSGVTSGPTDAERLSNGNTLITEQLKGRVIEVDSGGSIVWQIDGLAEPKDAERLDNGNTLIVEYGNSTVIEVDNGGNIVWIYDDDTTNPNDAERIQNQLPNAPTITGPKKGVPNIPYPYIILGADPDGLEIYYFIDWDDGNDSGWLGPYLSGTPTIPIPHTWTTQDIYTVRAKIRDINGEEGPWGELEVNMPRARTINSPFLHFLINHPNLFPIIQLLLQRLELI
jgi:hypothetical protein